MWTTLFYPRRDFFTTDKVGFQVPSKRKLFVNTLPPLGILGIASYLEKNVISVDILDYQIKDGARVNLKDYDIVGLSVNIANIATSLEFIRHIKIQNPKVKVIVGGPSCISNPQYFTQNENIDAVCTGEGEEAFLDYIAQESFIDGKETPGLYTKTKKGYFVYGGDRGYISDLDGLPFPALNKVNFDKYNVSISKESPISNIMTSRGCPFHCIFCFHSLGYHWRARSPVNVVDEIEWQVKELDVREICIQDDNFSLDLNRAKQIFDLILKRNIKVKLQFCNGLRVDFVDFELLKKMYEAGVWMIGVGDIVDCLISADAELLRLFYEYTSENYLYSHMINTTIMSTEVGLGLGYNKSRLNELGLASFLHDIGMIKVEKLGMQARRLSEAEYNEIKNHAAYGADILSKIKDINEPVIYVAKEEHERMNGTGYPNGLKNGEISEYARVVMIVDVYEALTHDRPYRKKNSPHDAVKEMIANNPLFDSNILKALINKIGVYPISSWIELNSNEIGKVMINNNEFPLRPVINILFDATGNRLKDARVINLAKQFNLFIKKPISDEELAREIKEPLEI